MLDKIMDTFFNTILLAPFWIALVLGGVYIAFDFVQTMLILVESIFTALVG